MNNSLEHNIFLKKNKRRKTYIHIFQLMIFILFMILWELLALNKIINTFIFSSPTKIINTFYQLFIDGLLFKHISITSYEIFISIFLSLSIGLLIAIIMWLIPFLSKVIDPYLTILNSLPKVALGPLIIIWFGANIKSIIFMSLMISLFVTIINIYTGFQSVPISYITMIKSFGASKWQIFKMVVFPYNFKNILSTLKVNVSMNLIGVIMGELLVSKKGLGYLLLYGSQVFNIDLVITCVFILGLLSYLLYFFIQKIK